ncbi:MAG: transferrin-binding protein-like solute binding protein [Boseongicola sp. SB0662_bin_57]|nr:transferrin-binding protein-like solute binding protein [Boseongicola sp. SB0662_bin_57]
MDSTTAQGDKYYGYAGNTENAGAILSIPLGHGYAWNETASTDYTTFGGWMQDTFFVAQINRSGVASEHGRPIGVTEDVAVFGNRTGSSPTAASLKTTLSRRAHWTGAMVGVDKSIASNSPRYGRGIVGRSSLILNEISNPSSPLTVRLFDMIDTVEGKSYSDIVWDDVAINNDGDFRVEDGSSKVVLWGTFYGADHREAGGVFDKNSIVGSFGATRDPALQDATD